MRRMKIPAGPSGRYDPLYRLVPGQFLPTTDEPLLECGVIRNAYSTIRNAYGTSAIKDTEYRCCLTRMYLLPIHYYAKGPPGRMDLLAFRLPQWVPGARARFH